VDGAAAFSWNNAREHFDDAAGIYDTNGNPTPTLSEPLKDGGQFAPQSGGSGSGNIYINAKWQFNANAMYQAPYGIEVSGNVFGRQGYPFPLFRQGTDRRRWAAIDACRSMVTPAIDYLPTTTCWNTDLRAGALVTGERVTFRATSTRSTCSTRNTALVRNNNITVSDINARPKT
jgi:hypothetical protein